MFPKNLLIICLHPPLTPPLTTEPYCFHSAAGQRSRLWGKRSDQFLITVLVDPNVKIPAWYCLENEAVMLFDLYFTLESKLGWHRLFLTVESTRGIRTLVVVFKCLRSENCIRQRKYTKVILDLRFYRQNPRQNWRVTNENDKNKNLTLLQLKNSL